MKKHRPPVDERFWKLFCIATTDEKCCQCGRRDVNLERGHIVPFKEHPDGGYGWDNLIPVCKQCNAKNRKKHTPDNRNKHWREEVIRLLALELKPELLCSAIGNKIVIVNRNQPDENTKVVTWQTGPKSGVSAQSVSQSLTTPEAYNLMRALVNKSQEVRFPPRMPFRKRQDELTKAALDYGRDLFWNAGLEFISERSWDPLREGGEPMKDAWQPLAEAPWAYVEKYRKRQAAEKQAHEAAIKRRHAESIQKLKDALFAPLHIPDDCAILTDDDRAFVKSLRDYRQRLGSGEPDTTHLACSVALSKRYEAYAYEERRKDDAIRFLGASKQSQFEVMKQLHDTPWYDADSRSERPKYEVVYYKIKNATTIAEVHALDKRVSELFELAEKFKASQRSGSYRRTTQ